MKMKSSNRVLGGLAAAGLLCGVFLPSGLAAAEGDPMTPYAPALVPRDSRPELLHTRRSASKVTDDLRSVVQRLRAHDTVEGRVETAIRSYVAGAKPGVVLDGELADLVEVYVHVESKSPEVLRSLVDSGLRVDAVSPSRPLVQGFVGLWELEYLEANPHVREIRRPNYGAATAGAVQSQGDLIQGTNIVRLIEGLDASGIVVGVISTGLFEINSGGVVQSTNCLFPQITGDVTTRYPITTLAGECIDISGPVPAPLPDSTTGPVGGIPVFPIQLRAHGMDEYFGTLDTIFTLTNPFPEGLAMMEVINDVAPNAEFIYGDGRTDINLELARLFFGNGQLKPPPTPSVDGSGEVRYFPGVIVDNVYFTGAGRYDGTSAISRGAAQFATQGLDFFSDEGDPFVSSVPYFVTAGAMTPDQPGDVTRVVKFPLMINGFFNPDPRDTQLKVHSWSAGAATNRDEALNITFATNLVEPEQLEPIEITLVWDDFWDDTSPRATIDLDLYLVPRGTLRLEDAVAASVSFQNGAASNPVERLTYFPTGGEQEPLALVMVAKNRELAARTFFTLTIESGQVEESKYLTHGVALNNSDALPPVISVGYIDIAQSTTSVPDGNIPGLAPGGALLEGTPSFLQWYTGQRFPTVMGYGSVATVVGVGTTSEEFSFFGSSAAVSHVGGFGALLRKRFPNMPASRMYTLLSETEPRSDAGGQPLPPFATDVTAPSTAAFPNAPTYRLPNMLSIYRALIAGDVSAYSRGPVTVIQLTKFGQKTAWVSEDALDPTAAPVDVPFGMQGLSLGFSDGLEQAGAWQSPPIRLRDNNSATGFTTAQQSNRTYRFSARLSSFGGGAGASAPDVRLIVESGDGSTQSVVEIPSSDVPVSAGGDFVLVDYSPPSTLVGQSGMTFRIEGSRDVDTGTDGSPELILSSLQVEVF